MKNGGCWIFLSHSSKDIMRVRMIRNAFEKNGQNPLAFHLRCLTTDTEEGKRELDNLIKREIEAREWFVFCESDAARASQYVRMEKEYIKKFPNKKIWTIDMTLSDEEIIQRVEEICTLLKVFVSYRESDCAEIMDLIADELEKKDFDVRLHETLSAGTSWLAETKRDIKEAATSGFILILITPKYLESVYCQAELRQIMRISEKAKIIAIKIGNVELPDYAKALRAYSIPTMPSRDDAHLIAELIEADLKRGIKGPIRYQADALNKMKEISERLNYEGRYHAAEARCTHAGGAADDYIEIYEFPCCGRTVVVGDGPVSRFRSDGCCKPTDTSAG